MTLDVYRGRKTTMQQQQQILWQDLYMVCADCKGSNQTAQMLQAGMQILKSVVWTSGNFQRDAQKFRKHRFWAQL